jgi:hypothetical protein
MANAKSKSKVPAKKPVGKKPVGKKPVGKKPVGKKPVGKKPVGKKPVGKKSVGKKSAAKDLVQTFELGHVHSDTGQLALLDLGLLEHISFETLQPGIVVVEVPKSPMKIFGIAANSNSSAPDWRQFRIVAHEQHAITSSAKVTEVAIDLAQLAAIDLQALQQWQHDRSLDDKSDVIFWGKDASGLASLLAASSHRDGYGWTNLSAAQAEQRADKIARKKHEFHWQLSFELRPHSMYWRMAEAARDGNMRAGSTVIEHGTAWLALQIPTGAFPVFADYSSTGALVQIRIELSRDARF